MPDEIKEEPKEETPTEVTTEPVKEEEKQETPKEDYEKRYKDLQSAYNKRDQEVKEYKQHIENWKKLGEVIESDPELYKTVEAKIKGPTESNGEAPDEVKQTISQNVVREFETRYGLDKLPPEKAQEIRIKIGQEIQSVSGVSINDVPLSKLGQILEKGYMLATVGDKEEQARRQGYLEARENREAEFGNIPSSGVNSKQIQLTPDEQKVARRLNISDEDYAKYKDKN